MPRDANGKWKNPSCQCAKCSPLAVPVDFDPHSKCRAECGLCSACTDPACTYDDKRRSYYADGADDAVEGEENLPYCAWCGTDDRGRRSDEADAMSHRCEEPPWPPC